MIAVDTARCGACNGRGEVLASWILLQICAARQRGDHNEANRLHTVHRLDLAPCRWCGVNGAWQRMCGKERTA